jgi:hypothetical protein
LGHKLVTSWRYSRRRKMEQLGRIMIGRPSQGRPRQKSAPAVLVHHQKYHDLSYLCSITPLGAGKLVGQERRKVRRAFSDSLSKVMLKYPTLSPVEAVSYCINVDCEFARSPRQKRAQLRPTEELKIEMVSFRQLKRDEKPRQPICSTSLLIPAHLKSLRNDTDLRELSLNDLKTDFKFYSRWNDSLAMNSATETTYAESLFIDEHDVMPHKLPGLQDFMYNLRHQCYESSPLTKPPNRCQSRSDANNKMSLFSSFVNFCSWDDSISSFETIRDGCPIDYYSYPPMIAEQGPPLAPRDSPPFKPKRLSSEIKIRDYVPFQIEITPGQYKTLRSGEETLNAIDGGRAVHLKCQACSAGLLTVSDCEFVICPDCRCVSPTDSYNGTGIGLGMRQ